jgi:imidazolonepropionase-like amidohydrolase
MPANLSRACGAVVVASALLGVAGAQCTENSYAIRGAHIVTVNAADIPSGNIVICGGLISAVGADAAIPAGAQVTDGAGLTVYPGFINAWSQYGLAGPRPTGAPAPPVAPGPAAARPLDPVPINSPLRYLDPQPRGVTPERRAADILQPSETLASVRATGIVNALVTPADGIFKGKAALISLIGPTADDMILNPDVALVAELRPPGRGFSVYPTAVMGAVAVFRQEFLDAQRDEEIAQLRRRSGGSPGEAAPPAPYSHSAEALAPALHGEEPVILVADDQDAIERALRVAAEFHLKPIIAGARQAWKITAALKSANVPVLVSLQFDPANKNDLGADELKLELDQNAANAAQLARAGIPFALTGLGLTPKQAFFDQVRTAMQHGLSETDALKAITIWPARILGAADEIGSIEPGKRADLVIANGDLLAQKTAEVKLLFINGKPVNVENEKPAQPPGPGAPGMRHRPGPADGEEVAQ